MDQFFPSEIFHDDLSLGHELFFSFLEFQVSRLARRKVPSKSPQALILFFHPSFYHIIFLSPEFFMVVLHDLTHCSRVHQDFVGRVQVSFLLASRGANNSSFSSELEFCISSFFSAIQTLVVV